ncbi:MAG: class I SAM-dependent methyltransferase [Acidimicrobiales bacterium]|jgi:SAM-dependent methyltransferase
MSTFPKWASPGGAVSLRVDGAHLVPELVAAGSGTANGDAGYGYVSHSGRVVPGVWDLVLPGRRGAVESWADGYAGVRAAEGRGAENAAHYRRLPETSPDHPFAGHWAARAKSFAVVCDSLGSSPLDIVDVGAGNGWAGARLAALGHRVALVDVAVDELDGLGACHHHGLDLPAARAEFEHLPFESESVDVVLCVASFHYAANQTAAVEQAARVLRPGGRLIIVDSPVHRHLSSGQKMVLEQERRLAQSLEVAIPPTPGRGFVWKSSTRGEWADAGLSWAWAPPNRSARARLSRLRAYARVRREPADLLTFTGTKSTFNAIGNAT